MLKTNGFGTEGQTTRYRCRWAREVWLFGSFGPLGRFAAPVALGTLPCLRTKSRQGEDKFLVPGQSSAYGPNDLWFLWATGPLRVSSGPWYIAMCRTNCSVPTTRFIMNALTNTVLTKLSILLPMASRSRANERPTELRMEIRPYFELHKPSITKWRTDASSITEAN